VGAHEVAARLGAHAAAGFFLIAGWEWTISRFLR
jgi:hypothetical protein